jgi:hypothetical protein
MRFWNERVAAIADHVPIGLLALLSLVVTALVAAGLYYWPAWSPTRWPWHRLVARLRRFSLRRLLGWRPRLPRWRRRRRRKPEPAAKSENAAELPEVPAEVLVRAANTHAVELNYAEAVRERLRAIVRELIERGVIPYRPGWTVTELAASAIAAHPVLGPPLTAAVDTFSGIWYGLRPATVDDDRAMRSYADAVSRCLVARVGAR